LSGLFGKTVQKNKITAEHEFDYSLIRKGAARTKTTRSTSAQKMQAKQTAIDLARGWV
jgi:hypothetical protein